MADTSEELLFEDSAPINRIRVETALSRFPIHRLSKTGIFSIDLKTINDAGQTGFEWKVSHNAAYGQPGPLAYKVDTLVVNRKIDEAPRPLPEMIKLGSLRDICRQLGMEGHDTEMVKVALHQNASAYITAKFRYTRKNRKQWAEIGYTRYSVVFTGEALPDGSTADAVYVVLNPQYRKLLNEVEVRPLDYNYLFQLTPAPQRLYELLSFPMYGALSHSRPRARLRYSDFCLFAPVTRYYERDQMKKQMFKIHKPHKIARYIRDVEYEETVDAEGKPDWEMLYTPGPKAIAEYQEFTRKGIERAAALALALPAAEPADNEPAQGRLNLEAADETLLAELTRRGITEKKGRELLAGLQEGQEVIDQLEYTDLLIAQAPRGKFHNPPGLYIRHVEQNIVPPPSFESSRQRKLRESASHARDAAGARRAQLQIAYENYRREAVEQFIAKELPAAEHQSMFDSLKQQNREMFPNMTPAQIEELTHGSIRAELRQRQRVPLLGFEEFARRQPAAARK